MNVISWNCRSIGLPSNIRFLKNIIYQERPSLIFLSETRDNKGKMESLRRALQYDGLISVDSYGKSGGLALLWKVKDQIQVCSCSRNHIDVEVKVDGK